VFFETKMQKIFCDGLGIKYIVCLWQVPIKQENTMCVCVCVCEREERVTHTHAGVLSFL